MLEKLAQKLCRVIMKLLKKNCQEITTLLLYYKAISIN